MLIDIDPEPPLRPLDAPLTDAELTALAMAADPDAPLDEDAVPLHIHLAQFAGAALPSWYMAPATARPRTSLADAGSTDHRRRFSAH